MSDFYPFSPELVVEATTVCDRHCAGCYAPNTITKADPVLYYRAHPELFLWPDNFRCTLVNFDSLDGIAVRGGEPSLHPELPRLLELCHERSERVYLETHGRWILQLSSTPTENSLADPLAFACAELGTTIKVSFDSMHGLAAEDLKEMTDRLSARSIRWLVAITESDFAKFEMTRKNCQWVTDDKIIVQPKVKSGSALFRPSRGVVRVNSIHFDRLQTLPRFDEVGARN